MVTTHLAPAKGYGGISKSVASLVKAWSERGYSFSLTLSDASTERPLTVEDLDLIGQVPVRLYRTPRRSAWAKRWGFGWGAIPAIWSACAQADLVHIHGVGSWPTLIALAICRLTNHPMAVSLHAGLMATHLDVIRTQKPNKWRLYRLFVFPALRRAALLRATTELEANSSVHEVPGVPMRIVPNGIDLDKWLSLPWPRPGPVSGTGRTLCYLGRFSPEKGILSFLRLWWTVRREGDRLIVAGDGQGPYADAVKTDLQTMATQTPGAIELLPYQDFPGVQAILSRAHALVLPSGIEKGDLRENFGNVVIEAMASTRPVLVVRGLAWDDVEREGVGLLFDPTAPSLSDALERLRHMDAAALTAMGQRGRALVGARYDAKTIADVLWDTLDKAIPVKRDSAPTEAGA